MKYSTIKSVAAVLLTFATGLLVLWSIIHVSARTLLQEDEARDTTLRMMVWGHEHENKILREMADAYEDLHPDVRIEVIYVAHNNYLSKLKTMIAAGDPPDLFYLQYDLVPDFASLGLVLPMDEALDEMGGEWKDDIYPVLLQGFRFNPETQTRGDGPLWGIARDYTPLAMYVNVDLYEQAGVPVPYDGWTWDEFEEASRAIDGLGDNIFGAFMGLWADPLIAIIWNHGGELFEFDEQGNPDFTRPDIDNPGLIAAFERIRRLRIDEGIVYNAIGINRSGAEEFFTGRVGTIGPTGRWTSGLCEAIDTFRYAVVPMPHVPGVKPRSPIMTAAWGVSAKGDHPEETMELVMYLSSPAGQRLLSSDGLSISINRTIAESDEVLNLGRKFEDGPVYLDIAKSVDFQLMPRQREFEDILLAEQNAALRLGSRSIEEALANIKELWAFELSSPLKTKAYPRMPWVSVGASLLALIAAAVTFVWWRARKEKLGALDRAHERSGMGFISIWVIGFVALTAGPMFLSGLLALSRWSAVTPLGEAEFVGFGNFVHMFSHDPPFWKSIWVTAYYVVLAIPIGQLASLGVALLMNTEVRGIAVFRTIFFVPSVITGVVLGALWLALLNNDYGLINQVMNVPLGWFGVRAPNWFGDDAQWAAIPAFVMMNLWGVGSAMVIYLAGLKAIPKSLTEAAIIDGASAWHRLTHVTLPMLSPLIFFNFVMGIIGSFQVFTQAFVMTRRGPDDATLFYVLYLYLQAFEFHNMGYASAMAWVLFVVILLVTLLAFRGSRNLVHYEGLKS
ncbi:MAG: extracellular solute-binding protein [Planctomycetota bacterium]